MTLVSAKLAAVNHKIVACSQESGGKKIILFVLK